MKLLTGMAKRRESRFAKGNLEFCFGPVSLVLPPASVEDARWTFRYLGMEFQGVLTAGGKSSE